MLVIFGGFLLSLTFELSCKDLNMRVFFSLWFLHAFHQHFSSNLIWLKNRPIGLFGTHYTTFLFNLIYRMETFGAFTALLLIMLVSCTLQSVDGKPPLHLKTTKHRIPGQYIVVLQVSSILTQVII